MYEFITTCIIVIFSVASLKLAWFETLLPIHVFHLLHKLGFNYGIKNWNSFSEYESTREDWELFVAQSPYCLLTNLLTCPVCLSFHLSFWCALVSYIICLLWSINLSFLIVPVCTLTVPYIVNKLLK
jgi:hypothetical protein